MQLKNWLRRTVLASALLAAGIALPVQAQQAERPVRLVVNVGLQVLDPVVGTSFITRNFAYMVFDTLVSMDSKGNFRPQMLEGWKISDDGLTYTFTLRPGLEWHDGKPVTAEDCVASIKRWGGRDSTGRRLMAASKDLRATSENQFVLELSRPFGGVIDALGKPSVHVPFMMPARIAGTTPPTEAVKEIVGSGPFLFIKEEWVPGEKTVFRRNPRYRPREEPADGLAGGKVVHVERAEFINIGDPATRAAALRNGEVDYLEYAPLDFLPVLQRDRNLTLAKPGGIAQIMGGLALNHAQPPFNNLKVRQALQTGLDQSETVAVHGLPEGMFQPICQSMTMCGTRYATEAGSEALREPSLERARAMLKESGYNNERVVLLHPADSALINPMAMVVADRMKRMGLNVDQQTLDWATAAQRWLSREPVEKGGWSAVPVVYTGFDLSDPLSNLGIGYNCTGTAPWLYCDEALTPLLQRFEAEADLEKRREIMAEINRRALANVNFMLTGQFSSPAVWRKELKGVIDFGFPVLWNIRREAS
ncbi:ABC transporter substrate-binding protein [Roseomonas marmotae]|uniref:ABC transporter substrate-binding protein n=1 Tax=Roseomonas marmotae TaxID=2768161 RepID=A0ABS3KEJ7_9PROT|nr:ABC transporter substrate-binding protein [Roseomonas marmotae]MBO1075884.1 ABC transporter substrate-binding protein [Roseomonas marmotae]QTI81929.1 ABC transporter substrate-binding protein [Roseomonas marmotae]